MNPLFYYPIKPWHINQPWGVPNDIYKQFGFSRHNGIDVALGTGALICAPFDGVVYSTGYQPNGGGIYFGFLSDNEYKFPDGKTCRVLLDFLHLKEIKGNVNKNYKAGDTLAIADNTGFSTGPHTHIQPRRVLYDGKQLTFIDSNDANGSFDPTPYWNGKYAIDIQISYITKLLGILNKILKFSQK